MTNPLYFLASFKALRDHMSQCPKCRTVIIHRTLRPGEKLVCKKCGSAFDPRQG